MPWFTRSALVLFAVLLSGHLSASAQSAGYCELSLENSFGPFDYRTATREQKNLVEGAHFNANVESLTRGQSGPVGGDIDYTLRVFPNHPRALMSMARLARKEKKATPTGSRYPIDCWFERALSFQPDDAQVRLVYGVELLKDGKRQAAIEHLTKAQELAGDNANVHYNLGLAYFDLNDFDKSLTHAQRAYDLGFPLPGLRDKLKRAGKWPQ